MECYKHYLIVDKHFDGNEGMETNVIGIYDNKTIAELNCDKLNAQVKKEEKMFEKMLVNI